MLQKDNTYLAGKLLLAMPHMNDPRFSRAVIFMCAHDAKGAMGMAINKPVPGMTFGSLLGQFNISIGDKARADIINQPVLSGGPVETVRGFMIHGKDFVTNDTVHAGSFSISGTLAALKATAQGLGPAKIRFTLGYAGWSAGQLEQEIQENVWMTVPATHELVFNTSPELMWDKAFGTLGVNPALLSQASGRA